MHAMNTEHEEEEAAEKTSCIPWQTADMNGVN